MGKKAFIFPGQGTQYVGMAKDFFDKYEVVREIFEMASRLSGLNVMHLCFEENEQINITEFTQISMIAVEISIWKVLQEKGYIPDVTAGLSLGEYGALAVSGAMGLEDIFRVVRYRGILMQEAYPVGGAMSAVVGLENKQVEDICAQIDGQVSVANYNCPGQVVITGEISAVNKASEELNEAGADRVIPLQVSGPFHSPLFREVGEKLRKQLDLLNFKEIEVPYLSNVTGDYVTDARQISSLLAKQVSAPVRWQQSIERMVKDGVDTFVEIGPGKTLSRFLKKIDNSVTAINIDKLEDLEKLVKLK